MNEKDPYGPNIYDRIDHIGDIPPLGTPVEVGLDVRTVDRHEQLQGSIDSGELGEIAKEHARRDKAVGFRFTGPKKVSMFVADHSHGILRAGIAGAVGVAGVAVTAAIILYEHRKGKSE